MNVRGAWDRVRVFNVRELLVHRGRTALSLLVVAVSSTLLVAVLCISGSVTGSAERLTGGIAGDAALEVSGITDAGFDAGLHQAVAQTPGVGAAVAMVRTNVGRDRLLVLGADAGIAALHSDLQSSLGGAVGAMLSVPGGVIAGPGTGLAKGDRLTLGGATVTVAAVVDDPSARELDGGRFVAAAIPTAQRIADRPGRLDSILITLAPGADRDTVRAALTDAVHGRAIVADPMSRAAQAGGAVTLLRATTLLSASTALVVAGFLVYIAMSMSINQRRPMISVLRAIGGRRRLLVRDLLAEAALTGLVGSALGAVVGILVGRAAIGRLPAAIISSLESRTEFVLPWYAVPVAILACTFACVVAAGIAARQVHSVAPVEAMAPAGVATTDLPGWVPRTVGAVLGVAGLAAAVATAIVDFGRGSILTVPLMFVAATAICFALAGPIVRAAAAVAHRFGAPGVLGATTIERAPRRVWATVMTVITAVVSMVAVAGSQDDLIDAATDSFSALADVDLYISGAPPDVFPTGQVLPADLVGKLAALPGVAGVGGGQLAYATIGETRVTLFGATPDAPNNMYRSVDDSIRRRVDAGEGVLVSRDVARSEGLHVGDRLDLPTPSGPHPVQVLAVLPYFSTLTGAVVLGSGQMQEWYERPGDTILGLRLAPGADPVAVQDAVRRTAPADLYVYTGKESLAAVNSALEQGMALSRSITWIVVLVATIALLNTLMLSVLERRRELGVLRAMGSNRGFVLRTVLAEAAGIGLVGGWIGMLVGFSAQFLSARALSHVVTLDVVHHVRPMLFIVAGAALVLTLAGAIPPAIRAARLNIVEAVAIE